MRSTLAPRGPAGHYPAGERVAQRVARRLGCEEGTAKQKLYGRARINLQAAAIIEELVASGDRAALARFLNPIIAAQRALFSATQTSTLDMQAQTADLDEDAAEKAYDKNQCAATAEQLVRAKDLEILLQLEARQALVNQWGLSC